jgi:chromatin assembly factor 1 subunit A
MKLLQSLRDAESVIRDLKLPKLDTILAKISRDEEKVLKFEREAEKQRLAEQAKNMKEQEMESKRREKEQLAEEKRKEKERKKQEAENKKVELEKKKQEAEQAREEAKTKKTEKREKRGEEKKQEEEQKKQNLKKQKACLLSFFAAPKKKKSKSIHESADDSAKSDKAAETAAARESSDAFDVDVFSKINSLDSHAGCRPLFETLSRNAIASRKRRTRKVAVSVYITVMPDDEAFGAQPFAEQKVIKIPNKYRFLGFREDCRPAYHGTWSKKSSIVTGRNIFGKDPSHLDYDFDSEAEWEEGDDEMGEDVEDEAKNQEEDNMEDEEGDTRIYDYDDGFCVADEQYLDIDENVDEETKVLYKKKLKNGQNGDDQAAIANRVSIIAPVFGGIPLEGSDNSTTNLIEGFRKQEGLDLLSSHQGVKLLDVNLCLDAFRPALVDEGEVTKDAGTPSGGNAGKDEYSIEEMRSLARFVHHCTLNSKEKVIEELRNARSSVFSSRAKATRKLDSIAVKKRCTNATGVYWEVKKEVLEELGLQDLLVSSVIVRTLHGEWL